MQRTELRPIKALIVSQVSLILYKPCLFECVGHVPVVSLTHLTPTVLPSLCQGCSLSSPKTFTSNNWTPCTNQYNLGNSWVLKKNRLCAFKFQQPLWGKVRWYTNTHFYAETVGPSDIGGFPSQWINKERCFMRDFEPSKTKLLEGIIS